DVKAAIGTAFRFSSADMVYSIDVMKKMGIIVPKGKTVGQYDVLRPYVISGLTYGFEKYAKNILTEIYNKPLKQLSDETSMRAIENYLKKSEKIYLMHNQNDFILKEGDINYFKQVFGDRAYIYPYGGHCGNMDHKDNVAVVQKLFKLK
ncbi:MAG TPA: alpha/beta hydrolase, partial [Alphaproteobacteria bacterium]|nr:alpha/beta hydrolase [Alphaproteobacteria bacterium]